MGLSAALFVPVTDAAASPAASVLYGVVDGRLMNATPSQADRILNEDASIGIRAVRVQLSWAAVQYGGPDSYDWASFDQIVSEVAAHHMSLLVLVDFTPPWARPAGCDSFACPPADPARFATFAATAARRYGSHVKAWEIWNEPNSAAFWQPKADPAAYSTLLTDTARAIRAVDPGAYIVSGGMAPEPNDGYNINPVYFLAGVCQAGGLRAPDAIGMHPYSYPVMPNYQAIWNAWQQMSATPINLRSVEASCGVPDKPIWITEYGAPTNGPGFQATGGPLDLLTHPDHVSEQAQAAMISQAVADVKSYGWVGAFFVYSATDAGTLPTTTENFFGLRTYFDQPKPAWGALAAGIGSGG